MPLEDQRVSSNLIEKLPEGFMMLTPVIDTKGGIEDYSMEYVNSVGKKMLKLTEEALSKNLSKHLRKKSWQKLKKELALVFNKNGSYAFTQKVERKKRDLWFRFHAVKDKESVVLTFHEVTTEVEQHEEIKGSENKYRKLFEESMDSIFLMNNEHLILEANHSMIDFTGYEKEELRFFSIQELFKNKEEYWELNSTLLKRNRVEEFEASLTLANGKTSICVINIVEIPEKNQHTAIYQGVIKDITQRRRAEKELIIAEKLSMTGKIARSMAHEVRNPLTNLNLALEQLKDEFDGADEDAELYFNIIERNAKRIEELLSGLLDSSKPKSLAFKRQSINKVVNSAIDKVVDRMSLLNIDLSKSLASKLPQTGVDQEQLEIALVNLMINAIEAMQTKGGMLTVISEQSDEQIKITIKDDGPGIPKEHLQNLFDPFFSAKKGGLGLGLTSVQNIIKSHHGNIEVESEVGQGTSFYITIPL